MPSHVSVCLCLLNRGFDAGSINCWRTRPAMYICTHKIEQKSLQDCVCCSHERSSESGASPAVIIGPYSNAMDNYPSPDHRDISLDIGINIDPAFNTEIGRAP